ncbi:MAG TPA: DUF2635 domain-containing protein [Xanthobacteraceae bacterium]|nr:DUF2635 domain-containing protein [Xanthobacteraceae bacterium]
MDTVYVKPAPGGRVRQPERAGRVMPEEGDHVQRDAYYERLILGGDVVVSEPPSSIPNDSERPAARSRRKED